MPDDSNLSTLIWSPLERRPLMVKPPHLNIYTSNHGEMNDETKKFSYKVADKDKRVAVIIIMKKKMDGLLITTLLTPLFTFINSRRTNTNVLSHRNVHNSQDRSQNLPGSLTYPLGE